jgi:hypothetical protein
MIFVPFVSSVVHLNGTIVIPFVTIVVPLQGFIYGGWVLKMKGKNLRRQQVKHLCQRLPSDDA